MSSPFPETSAIPLTVLTGFLGSGKTTLLKRLIAHPGMAGTGIVINEFGVESIDDALVEKADDDTVVLSSGCVCCTVRGDLVEALDRLYGRMVEGKVPKLDRVVVETTGLADPAPIVHTLMTEEVVYRVFQLDGVVTTVDAEQGLGQLEKQLEPAKQAAIADRIVLTKTDRTTKETADAVIRRLKAINPAVEIITAVKGDIEPDRLFGLGAHEVALSGANPERWLGAESYAKAGGGSAAADCHAPACSDPTHHHEHHHDHACSDHACDHPDHHPAHEGHLHGIASFCLTFDEPLDGAALADGLKLLSQVHGERLLRVKGILDIRDQRKPFVLHGVQHVFYPPDTLQAWPSGPRRSRLVFITKDLPEADVRALLKPFMTAQPGW